ncbi:MAG: inverse autotransporter beta domain-containing protein, partial [Verrucomicrobiota bacterium]
MNHLFALRKLYPACWPVALLVCICLMLQPGWAEDDPAPAAEAEADAGAEAAVDAAAADAAAEAEAETGPAADLPHGYFTVGLRLADDEAEGHGDITVPVWYDPDVGMFLLDTRASFSDDDEEELNIGLVYRKLLPNDKGIFGLNAYYDARWTDGDTRWDQFGFGAELLSFDLFGLFYDLRFNYYLPESGQELVDVTERTSVSQSSSSSTTASEGPLSALVAHGNAIGHNQVTTFTTRTTTRTTTTRFRFERFEAALEGWDIELGVLVPGISDIAETRVFLGYQEFDNPFGDDFEGFKGRLEVTLAFEHKSTGYRRPAAILCRRRAIRRVLRRRR